MARTSETLTKKEVDAFQAFCREHNIVADESEAGLRNGDEIANYIVTTWGQDITQETLTVALDKLRDRIIFYTPAQAEYLKVANQEPDRANQLAAWLQTQGKPEQLVNQGDQAFDNVRLLLLTLRGYEINAITISHAIDRIQSKPGPKLHYVQAPRRTEPQSRAARNDDGKPFLGEHVNEPAWVKRSRERSEREAAEKAETDKQSGIAAPRAAAEAKARAESLQGATHSETDQLRKIFVTNGTTEIDWQATLQSRLALQARFTKHRETARFIR